MALKKPVFVNQENAKEEQEDVEKGHHADNNQRINSFLKLSETSESKQTLLPTQKFSSLLKVRIHIRLVSSLNSRTTQPWSGVWCLDSDNLIQKRHLIHK